MDWHGVATTAKPRDRWRAFVEARQKELGCFLQFDPELCRSDSATSGPLAGVPFGVKDNIAVRTFRLTCGSRMLERFRLALHGNSRSKAASGRRGGSGEDQSGRVRDGIFHGKLRPDGNQEPVGPGTGARRLQRRLRGGGCFRAWFPLPWEATRGGRFGSRPLFVACTA